MNRRSCVFFTLFLMVIVFLCFGSKARGSSQVAREYYKALEDNYVKEVKKALNDMGYSNAGVSLTKVVDGEYVEYTISIHHKRIDKMDEAQRNELSDIILSIDSVTEDAVMRVKYIEYA